MFLKIRRASEVIGVTVTDDDDLHHRRIEAELLKSRQELCLRITGRQRIDHQQAGRSLDDVRNSALIADHVDVVEDFGRFYRRIGRTVCARRFAEEVRFLRPSGVLRPFSPSR